MHKLLPAPPAEIHFHAKAEILPYEDEGARKVYKKFFKIEQEAEKKQSSIWIKITPSLKIATCGVGVKLLDMRKPEKACKVIKIK